METAPQVQVGPGDISTGAGVDWDFRVSSLLGTVSFGEIYHSTNVETKEQVSIKLESLKARFPHLIYKAKIYRNLRGERIDIAQCPGDVLARPRTKPPRALQLLKLSL